MTTLTAPADSAPAPSRHGTAGPGPLRAAHTADFPALLQRLGASLLVTSYQAGKLVLVRDEGDHLKSAALLPLDRAAGRGRMRCVATPPSTALQRIPGCFWRKCFA